MSSKKIDDLIENLSKQAPSQGVLKSPWIRFFYWLVTSLLFSSLLLIYLGMRGDLAVRILTSGFWIENALLLLVVISSGAMAFFVSVPGNEKLMKRSWAFAPLLLWFALQVGPCCYNYDTHIHQSEMGIFQWSCFFGMFLIGLVPFALLLYSLRKSAPVFPRWVGILASLSALGLSGLAMQFHCQCTSAAHILISHGTPILIGGAVGILWGKFILRW